MKKAIVIGSGLSGLTSALYLQKSGYQTTILEQQELPGGVTRSLEKEGFVWDQGQLIIEGMGFEEKAGFPLDELNIRKKLKLIPGDRGYIFPDYSVWPQKEYTGFDWRIDYLSELFPEQKKGLKQYFRLYKAVTKASWAGLKSDQSRGIISSLWKLRAILSVLPYLSLQKASAAKICDKYFSDPKLASCFLSLLADFEVDPDDFPGLGVAVLNEETAFDIRQPLKMPGGGYQPSYHYIGGGTRTLVKALLDEFQISGGELHCSSRVNRIKIENNTACGVIMENGDSREADLVIANMQAKKAFFELVDKSFWPADFATQIENIPLMQSVFMVHVGFKGNLLDFQQGPLGYYYKTYDLDEAIESVFSGEFGAGNFGYVIYAPSCHSPEMAPKGYTAMTIYTVAPNVTNKGKWSDIAEESAEILIKRVEDELIPGLSQKIKTKIIVTPEDFRNSLNVSSHSFGGMAPSINGKGAPHKTPLKNYWFVGAESVDGGTVTSTIYGAWKAMKELGVSPLKKR